MIICRLTDYVDVIDNELTMIAYRESLMVIDSIISSRCGYGSIFDEVAQENYRIRLMPIAAYERINYSGYAVRAYPAYHGTPDQVFLIYIIAQGGNSVLYATDTAVIFDDVWHMMSEYNECFDLIILDHTYGVGMESSDHLAMKGFAGHVRRFREEGMLKPDGSVYATHISHERNYTHSEFEAKAEESGYRIAYDGLRLELE